MQFYALVNSNRVEEVAAEESLTLKEMQSLVGFPGEEAFVEPVYYNYSDKPLVMLCDEDFLKKACQPTCITLGVTVL